VLFGCKKEVKFLQHELLFKEMKYIRNLMKQNLLLVTYTETKSSSGYAQKWGGKWKMQLQTNIILTICNCYMAITAYQNNTDQFHHITKTAHALQLPEAVPLTIQVCVVYTCWSSDSFMRDVKQFWDCHYPEELVGRNVLVLWPPRSPDLTPVEPSRDTVYWQTVNRRNEFVV